MSIAEARDALRLGDSYSRLHTLLSLHYEGGPSDGDTLTLLGEW